MHQNLIMTAEKSIPETGSLVNSLTILCDGYRQTKKLLNDQITAVIGNDLQKLNELIKVQTETYDELQKSEERFREELVCIFQRYYPNHKHPSLKKVIEAVEGPAAELGILREKLNAEIYKTEKIRSKLVELLEFASEYNQNTIAAFANVAGGGGESYSASGVVARSEIPSIGVNRKV